MHYNFNIFIVSIVSESFDKKRPVILGKKKKGKKTYKTTK